MSDTNDLREQVEYVIGTTITDEDGGHVYDWFPPDIVSAAARQALAVATPLIRAQVIEELIAAWEAKPSTYEDVMGATVMFDLTKWLRAQADEPDDRKIYIGFKDKPKDKGKEDDQ
jgi:hypothetical protein